MPGAFVVINTELGGEQILLDQLRQLPAVKEAYIVYGVYDLVVRLEGNDLVEIKDDISDQIRKLDNVKSTLTMIVA